MMTKLTFALAPLVLITAVAPYQARTAQSLPMKGYELYSWQTRGDWYFSLLYGTNRLKTREEIMSPKVRVKGVEALKRRLQQLNKGAEISWPGQPTLRKRSLPPDEIVRDVRAFCDERGLILRLAQ